MKILQKINLSTQRYVIAAALLVSVTFQTRAAVPAAEQMLPADTLVVFSVPEWTKLKQVYNQSPQGQLWQDQSMKEFRDNFNKKLSEEVLAPFERELGVKLADYAELLQGQVTLAVTRNGWDGKSDKRPGFLLLIDSKDKGDQLKKHLTTLRQKWVDAGKAIKNEKIRDTEFSTLVINGSDIQNTLDKVFPSSEKEDDAGEANNDTLELTIGQSDSLLVIGNTIPDIEKVLNRKAGGSVPSLAEQSAYEANHSALFRDAVGFAWINFKPVFEVISRQIAAAAEESEEAQNPMVPKTDKVIAAMGLNALSTISLKFGNTPEGSSFEAFLSVPESSRQGLFKILAVESKDSAPPPFVPSDVVKFTRWRLDGQKMWTTVESMLTSISPEMAGILQMGLSTLGKDKDPNFDLKRNLIGNLGDDFISLQKAPQTAKLQDLNTPPSLMLIGSANPEKLAQGLRAMTSLLPTGGEGPKEREFLGRKVYSVQLPAAQAPGAAPIKQTLSFAASGSYVAVGTDTAFLEEFLRSTDGSGKSLREVAGLGDAAQRVGGMGTGFFGYENQATTMRATLEALKNDNASLQRFMSTIGSKSDDDKSETAEWFDFSKLPAYERIAKYFHFVVYSGSVNAQGLSWKMFNPTPPQMRK